MWFSFLFFCPVINKSGHPRQCANLENDAGKKIVRVALKLVLWNIEASQLGKSLIRNTVNFWSVALPSLIYHQSVIQYVDTHSSFINLTMSDLWCHRPWARQGLVWGGLPPPGGWPRLSAPPSRPPGPPGSTHSPSHKRKHTVGNNNTIRAYKILC